MDSVHPLADEWSDEYLLYSVEHNRIGLSRPLRHFLAEAVSSGRKSVLITPQHAVLSPQLYSALVASAGHWAFRGTSGVYDARSGAKIRRITDLWSGTGDAERHALIIHGAREVPAVMFDAYVAARATPRTEIGSVLEHVVLGLGGGRIVRFGDDEPLASVWHKDAVTKKLQRGMPIADAVLAGSESGAWATLRVGRTRDGLMQRIHGGVPLPGLIDTPTEALRDVVMPSVTTTFSALAEQFRVRIALASAGKLWSEGDGVGYRVGATPVGAPLAALLGAPVVRDLRLDLSDFGQRHDVTVIGPGRVPSALVRMTGADPLWAQYRAALFDLDQERLHAALYGTRGGGG